MYLEIIETDEDPIEVAYNNLKIADMLHNLELFTYAKIGYFKNFPHHTPQDLERYLRFNNFSTYLIATKPRPPNGINYKLARIDNTECRYECIISCHQYAMRELLENWPSYNDNFDALHYAGDIVLLDDKSVENLGKAKKRFKWRSSNNGQK